MSECFQARDGLKAVAAIAILVCMCSTGHAQAVSALFARGYTVIPEPQRVVLESEDFAFGENWHLQLGKSVPSKDIAVELLRSELATRFHVNLAESDGQSDRDIVSLSISPGSVQIGNAQDKDK